MSHQRRTAQAFRFSAIVTASMASIGLTVAAGSYIANQIAHEPGKLAITPPAEHPALIELGGGADQPEVQAAAPIAEKIGLTSFYANRPAESGTVLNIPARVPGTGAATAAEVPHPLGAQLKLGTTYLGAQVAAAQHDSLTLTVDTNVFAAIADVLLHTPLGEQLGINADPTANTQLRTDVDSHGDVTLTLSDPGLGRYGVQIVRHPVPAATSPADNHTSPADNHASPADTHAEGADTSAV